MRLLRIRLARNVCWMVESGITVATLMRSRMHGRGVLIGRWRIEALRLGIT